MRRYWRKEAHTSYPVSDMRSSLYREGHGETFPKTCRPIMWKMANGTQGKVTT